MILAQNCPLGTMELFQTIRAKYFSHNVQKEFIFLDFLKKIFAQDFSMQT